MFNLLGGGAKAASHPPNIQGKSDAEGGSDDNRHEPEVGVASGEARVPPTH